MKGKGKRRPSIFSRLVYWCYRVSASDSAFVKSAVNFFIYFEYAQTLPWFAWLSRILRW